MNETATTTAKLQIEIIGGSNSAFGDADGNVGEPYFIALETARILRELADKLEGMPSLATTTGRMYLRDHNGNVVGHFNTEEF